MGRPCELFPFPFSLLSALSSHSSPTHLLSQKTTSALATPAFEVTPTYPGELVAISHPSFFRSNSHSTRRFESAGSPSFENGSFFHSLTASLSSRAHKYYFAACRLNRNSSSLQRSRLGTLKDSQVDSSRLPSLSLAYLSHHGYDTRSQSYNNDNYEQSNTKIHDTPYSTVLLCERKREREKVRLDSERRDVSFLVETLSRFLDSKGKPNVEVRESWV